MTAADPQLVLALLQPSDRALASVDLEPQSVLVSCADLTDRDAAFRAAIEPDEHGRKICAPTGGFTGRGDGKCPAWVAEALDRLRNKAEPAAAASAAS